MQVDSRARGRITAALAALVAGAMLLSGCFAGALVDQIAGEPEPSPTATERPPEATITWLAYRGDGSGTTGSTTIAREAPDEPGDFRVEFSATEVGGIGDQAQAGAWNAAIVATLLLGEPLEGVFRFETDGFVDGPSAGALTSVGLMSLALGDELLADATMTGTINTTGTIGPVGGIPEKIEGAAEAGMRTVGIPFGQRSAQNHAGETVDVVATGAELGIEVVEVADVFEAYRLMTGEAAEMRAPGGGAMAPASDVRLDDASYAKFQPQVGAALGRYETARDDVERMPDMIQQVFVDTGVMTVVDGYAVEAQGLQDQGLQAGAYSMAIQAATMMEGLAGTADAITPLFAQGEEGLDTILDQAQDTSAATRAVMSFLDQLAVASPKTVADAEGLVNAFAATFDALALLMFSEREVASLQARWEAGDFASLDVMFEQMLWPVMYGQLARAQVESARSLFEIGRGNDGASIDPSVRISQVGDFFRRGADANMATFESTFVAQIAEQSGVDEATALGMLGQIDPNIAMAIVQRDLRGSVEAYLGEGSDGSAYAMLGYGLSNYARNQALVDTYYNNAVLDENLQVVDVRYDAVLGHAIDLAREQLQAEVASVRDGGTEPVLTVASYEVADLMRSGTALDRLGAVSQFNAAFLTARMMNYLAGAGAG